MVHTLGIDSFSRLVECCYAREGKEEKEVEVGAGTRVYDIMSDELGRGHFEAVAMGAGLVCWNRYVSPFGKKVPGQCHTTQSNTLYCVTS